MADKAGSKNPNYRGGFATTCAVCSKAVWVKPSRAARPWHTCSKECNAKQLSETTTGPDHWRFQGGDVDRTCETCREGFRQRRAEFNRKPGRFCTPKCMQIGRRKRVHKTCDVCLGDFEVAVNKTDARFCSTRCKKLSQIKDRTAEEIARLRINANFTSQVWRALKGTKNGRKWEALIGYTLADLMNHLMAKFTDGMTWENYGQGWHIDHIRPQSSFEYLNAADPEFLTCWALSNLQPLWKLDNLRKGAKYLEPDPETETPCSTLT